MLNLMLLSRQVRKLRLREVKSPVGTGASSWSSHCKLLSTPTPFLAIEVFSRKWHLKTSR